MLINEACKKYHVSARTLRYYEEIGLIQVDRNESNIREYYKEAIQKIELILLFKKFGFELKEIKKLIALDNMQLFRNLLDKELKKIKKEQEELIYKKQMIQSVLNTYGSRDESRHSLLAFMKEQVYLKDMGKEFTMLTNTKDIEIVIGEGLIPCAASDAEDMLIAQVKKLREDLKKNLGMELDLVRIVDDVNLNSYQYQIKQVERVLIDKEIETKDLGIQTRIIIDELKSVLVNLNGMK